MIMDRDESMISRDKENEGNKVSADVSMMDKKLIDDVLK